MNCLLPEIASPRYTIRNDKKDIREPQYIFDAIDAKKKRDEKAQQAKERANLREEKAKEQQRKEQERSKQQKQRCKERERKKLQKNFQ